MEGWVGLGWLVGYIPKYIGLSVRHRELNPDTVAHLSNRDRRLTSLIESNALTVTTTPDHQTMVMSHKPMSVEIYDYNTYYLFE